MKKELKKIDLGQDTETVDEKSAKKEKRQERQERRKKTKQKDAISRWSGLILLGIILILSFILWVAGEMENGSAGSGSPAAPVTRSTVQFQ